ncbi:MAG: Two-component system sensor histidine kinase [uncultured Solirubrobacteraceae bacterium]|uniref:Two-component system sensor histidine kinase n=1 Tax=uncultured Solirubrobacteraceae bacterium TaxID=1162706 RepID=A0A6J4TC35_9ACTN|nr:MAG: Two-component system sensor histidine kinase [uncultured Solirubrobacteraceae bacterium]
MSHVPQIAAQTTGHRAPALRELRRDPERGMVAGVCEGIGRHLDLDPLLVRIVFGATTLASGLGLVAYLLAWWLLPVAGAQPSAAVASAERRTSRNRRAALEVGSGVGLLVVAILLTFRALGLPFSDALTWPLVLVAAGGALIWRQSVGRPDTRGATAAPAAGVAGAVIAPPPMLSGGDRESRPAVISRIGIGVTLVIAAAIVFLQFSGALAAASDVALAALVVAIALVVIFAPFFVRLLTSLSIERAERIRSQERAEVAAHLHDSVLQTLALMQKRADDPREVAALARRQERELRTWLNGAPARADGGRWLAPALQAAADEVEQAHGVAIDVVAVGDAPLDRDGEALVAAAREAMLNAAKFAGDAGAVAVYAEAREERIEVFVRDRGPGFDPAAVPADRRGVRESIVGRMERHGGRAAIHAAPGGGGTEVELVLERGEPS